MLIDRKNANGKKREGMEKCARLFMWMNIKTVKAGFFNLKQQHQHVINYPVSARQYCIKE